MNSLEVNDHSWTGQECEYVLATNSDENRKVLWTPALRKRMNGDWMETDYYPGNFQPSTDISAAWEVVEKLGDNFAEIRRHSKGVEVGEDAVWVWSAGISNGDGYSSWFSAKSAPEAICKAALLAILVPAHA